MASNSRFEQICGAFVTGLAAFMSYPTVAPQADTEDGWVLTGHATDPDLRVFKRERHRARNMSPPAVVLVGLGGDIVAPGEQGTTPLPGSNRDPATSEGKNVAAKQIRVRKFKIGCSLWGENQEQAETLLHNAINVFETLAHNALWFSDEQWTNQQPGQDANAAFGEMISFVATIGIDVMTAPGSIRVVATIDNALSLQTPTEVVNVNLSAV